MRKHLWSTAALLVMVFLAFGSVSSDKPAGRNPQEPSPDPAPRGSAPAPAAKTWPYQLVESKTELTGRNNVMDLYAFAGTIDPVELRAFCRERKGKSNAKVFYYVVVFDTAANARFPSSPFTAEYGDDENSLKHIRAIYVYNRVNGFSELRYHPQNVWEHVPTRERI